MGAEGLGDACGAADNGKASDPAVAADEAAGDDGMVIDEEEANR